MCLSTVAFTIFTDKRLRLVNPKVVFYEPSESTFGIESKDKDMIIEKIKSDSNLMEMHGITDYSVYLVYEKTENPVKSDKKSSHKLTPDHENFTYHVSIIDYL